MPPKRYHSRFPTARIKKIMQLDDDVGKVAAAVPLLVSRAVELFLLKVLTGTAEFADQRGAKTMTASHLKYTIDREPRFSFLKEETAKFPDVVGKMDEEEPEKKKRGRKRAELMRETTEQPVEGSPSKRKKRESPRKKGRQQESSGSESDSDDRSPELSMAHSEGALSKRTVIASTGMSPAVVDRASVIQTPTTPGGMQSFSAAVAVSCEPGTMATSPVPLTVAMAEPLMHMQLPVSTSMQTQKGQRVPSPAVVRLKQKAGSRK